MNRDSDIPAATQQQVGEILFGQPPVETQEVVDDSEQETAPQQETGEPEQPERSELNVKALAEKLELDPKDLYESLKIDIGNEETLSLGEIKDKVKDWNRSNNVMAEAENQRITVENELLQKRRELASMQSQMGIEVTPEAQEAARKQYAEYQEREHQATLAAIPEWTDPVVVTEDSKKMSGLLSEYGLSAQEIAQIADHRQIKLVRDYALLRDRIANAGEQQKKGTKQGQRNRNRSAPNRAAQAKKDLASGKISQSDAVLSIIADGAK